MSAAATVLIPTHEHGRLLTHAASSALDQTVSDIELFIVGDGVDDETREVARELAKADPRVRFFDNPKGPRHGELHRHAALQEATGAIVCYLADDDLWLPKHVETMIDLLAEADFAHALPLGIYPDGSLHTWVGHLGVPSSKGSVLELRNFIPLSCGAHTLDLYRQIPDGWRTTPEGVATDVFMWAQLLGNPGCVARSGYSVTVLHFPSPWRTDMTMEQRLGELEEWHERLAQEGFELEMTRKLIAHLTHKRATLEDHINDLRGQVEKRVEDLATAQATIRTLTAEKDRTDQQLQSLTIERERLGSELARRDVDLASTRVELTTSAGRLEKALAREDHLRRQQERMRRSLTWRTRDRLLRIPGLAAIARSVGRARARRGAT